MDTCHDSFSFDKPKDWRFISDQIFFFNHLFLQVEIYIHISTMSFGTVNTANVLFSNLILNTIITLIDESWIHWPLFVLQLSTKLSQMSKTNADYTNDKDIIRTEDIYVSKSTFLSIIDALEWNAEVQCDPVQPAHSIYILS